MPTAPAKFPPNFIQWSMDSWPDWFRLAQQDSIYSFLPPLLIFQDRRIIFFCTVWNLKIWIFCIFNAKFRLHFCAVWKMAPLCLCFHREGPSMGSFWGQKRWTRSTKKIPCQVCWNLADAQEDQGWWWCPQDLAKGCPPFMCRPFRVPWGLPGRGSLNSCKLLLPPPLGHLMIPDNALRMLHWVISGTGRAWDHPPLARLQNQILWYFCLIKISKGQ